MATIINPNGLVSQRIYNGLAPRELPKSVFCVVDCAADNEFGIDLALIEGEARIQFVQTIFIDNSSNNKQINIAIALSQVTLKCPANSQLWVPCPAPNQSRFILTCAAGNGKCNLTFFNVPMPAVLITGLT